MAQRLPPRVFRWIQVEAAALVGIEPEIEQQCEDVWPVASDSEREQPFVPIERISERAFGIFGKLLTLAPP